MIYSLNEWQIGCRFLTGIDILNDKEVIFIQATDERVSGSITPKR